MQLKISQNSLFAILLRSPWWISIGLVALFALGSAALLPRHYVPFGVMGAFPFLIIGIMAAWRQWRAPSPKLTEETLQRVSVMTWQEFSAVLEQGYARQGYDVTRLTEPGADLSIVKGGRTALVSCRRWKAATTGVDMLRELVSVGQKLDCHELIYIASGTPSQNAIEFASKHSVKRLSITELAEIIN